MMIHLEMMLNMVVNVNGWYAAHAISYSLSPFQSEIVKGISNHVLHLSCSESEKYISRQTAVCCVKYLCMHFELNILMHCFNVKRLHPNLIPSNVDCGTVGLVEIIYISQLTTGCALCIPITVRSNLQSRYTLWSHLNNLYILHNTCLQSDSNYTRHHPWCLKFWLELVYNLHFRRTYIF